MSLLKKNVFYSLLLTASRFLFPIITYPYLARVLGPDRIGVLSFADSFSTYFVLIAALGIPLYGVREIAKAKGNQKLLNATFTEISIIYFISTLFCTIVFLISVYTIPHLKQELSLNLISGLNIFISFISFEWFLIGIEKFRYLTTSSILTKLIPIILMFWLVKGEEDYVTYQILNIAAFLSNALINIIYLRKLVGIERVDLNVRRHISPLITVFFSSVFITFYSLVDTLILGFVSSNQSVGLYSAAIKLNRIVCLVIASIGNVLLPRISNLITLGDKDQINGVILKSLRITVMLTIPLSMGLYLLSSELIVILYGEGFANAVMASKILSPIVFFMGIGNVFALQILLPFSKERQLLYLFTITTGISVILNFFLARNFGHLGSATATLITEILLGLLSYIFAKDVITIRFPWKFFFISLFTSFLFVPIVLLIKNLTYDIWLICGLSFISCLLVYAVLSSVFLRNEIKSEWDYIMRFFFRKN
jgi:O-antigen/teichoic acid export membrane protein